jgi:hypothetical protein
MISGAKQIGLLLLGLALLAGAIWLLFVLRPLLAALLIAALLAYLLNPLVVRLAQRLGGKRPLAAALVFALALTLLAGLLALLGAVVWDQWPRLRAELSEALVFCYLALRFTPIPCWLTCAPPAPMRFRPSPSAPMGCSPVLPITCFGRWSCWSASTTS